MSINQGNPSRALDPSLFQRSNRLNVPFDGLVRFVKFPVILKRIVWPMNPCKRLVRGPVIHDENLTVLPKRTDIMVVSVGAHENDYNLGTVRRIDTVEGRFGKGRNIDIDPRSKLKGLFRTSWRRQGSFKFLKSLNVERELLLHPSDQIFVGFPPGHRFNVAFTQRRFCLGYFGLACFGLGRLCRRRFGRGWFRWRRSDWISSLRVGFHSDGFTGEQ